jgi:type III secretion protein R
VNGQNVQVSGTLSLLLALTLAGVLPMLALLATSFVKISLVLGSLRSALGVQQVPGSLAVLGLSALLTVHVMAPTFERIQTRAGTAVEEALTLDALSPAGRLAWARAWALGWPELQRFLRANARPGDRRFFVDLARQARARQGMTSRTVTGDDLDVLLPAFVLSELTRALMVAFLVLLPFLVVDLVVANVLVATGLQGVSHTTVALPVKLLLFVMADGWRLLAGALVLAYR